MKASGLRACTWVTRRRWLTLQGGVTPGVTESDGDGKHSWAAACVCTCWHECAPSLETCRWFPTWLANICSHGSGPGQVKVKVPQNVFQGRRDAKAPTLVSWQKPQTRPL